MTSLRYLLNCRSFIFLVVLFSFINNFSMEEEDEQFFEGISIKRLENGEDIATDEIDFHKSFAFIEIDICFSIFRELFYPNTDYNGFKNYKSIAYSIGEKKIHLYFKFFRKIQDPFLDLVNGDYDYFFLCFYTGLFNEGACTTFISDIRQLFIDSELSEKVLDDDKFYFVADEKLLPKEITDEDKKKWGITDFSEKNIENLKQYGKVLITDTDTGKNLLCKTDKKKEIRLDEENANTVEGCWLKIVLNDLNKKMKEEKKEKEIKYLQEGNSDNEDQEVEKNDEENEQNCCENICAFIKNFFKKN